MNSLSEQAINPTAIAANFPVRFAQEEDADGIPSQIEIGFMQGYDAELYRVDFAALKTATEEAEVFFASPLLKEPTVNNSADNSSFLQQQSFVLSTPSPYYTTGIKDISLRSRYAVIIIEHVRRIVESRPTSTLHDNLSSADKIDIAVEKLKNIGLVKSADYINYLRSTDDLEAGDQPLTAESVMGFAELMYRFRDLGEPMLGLFSEGTLSVEWRIADNKHLLIEPLDDKNASFAFIGPANKLGEEFHLDDRGTIEEVINTLRRYGVDRWKKNE